MSFGNRGKQLLEQGSNTTKTMKTGTAYSGAGVRLLPSRCDIGGDLLWSQQHQENIKLYSNDDTDEYLFDDVDCQSISSSRVWNTIRREKPLTSRCTHSIKSLPSCSETDCGSTLYTNSMHSGSLHTNSLHATSLHLSSAYFDCASTLGSHIDFPFEHDDPLSATANIVEAALAFSTADIKNKDESLRALDNTMLNYKRQSRERETKTSSKGHEEFDLHIDNRPTLVSRHIDRIVGEMIQNDALCTSSDSENFRIQPLHFFNSQSRRTKGRGGIESRSEPAKKTKQTYREIPLHGNSYEALPNDTTTSKTTRDDNFNYTSDENILEISPGLFVRLRSTDETMDAVRKHFFVECKCTSCKAKIFCVQDTDYVVCPECMVLSPMEVIAIPSTKTSNPNSKRTHPKYINESLLSNSTTRKEEKVGGVSMGFTEDELSRMKQEICFSKH